MLLGALVGPTTHFLPIYVKLLPLRLRAVEAVCAWLAHEVGLPAPMPAFVSVRKRHTKRLCAWPYGDEEVFECFGTLEIAPALPLRVVDTTGSDQVDQILMGWRDGLRVGVFDELIANEDRNRGNILIDARRELWIIDHSRALRAGGQRPFSDPFLPFENTLLSRIAKMPASQRHAKYQQAISACTQIAAAARRIPYDQLGVATDVRSDIERFIDERAQRLQDLVLSRLGIDELPHMPNGSGVRH